jgi:UDP-N-acetylglucosamine:LPS N-acetylglucosamine transferase
VENARFLEKAGAAVVFSGEADPAAVAGAIRDLAAQGEKRRAMAAAAAEFAAVDGAALIAGAITRRVTERVGSRVTEQEPL